MRKLGLLTAAAVLATAVGFAGAAKATPFYTVETAAPLSTENYWKTSSIVPGDPINSVYVPMLSEFDLITPDGYVSVIANGPDAWEVFSGNSTNNNDSRFLYRTYIVSDINQTIEIVVNGDDGHSLYVDGSLVDGDLYPKNSVTVSSGPGGGGGFGVGIVFELALVADVAVRLDLVGANDGGGWNSSIGVDRQVLTDGPGNQFLFPTIALTDVEGISMDAEGFGPPDADGDSVADDVDNCIDDANPGQEDVDEDGIGDACDPVRDVTIDIKPGSFPNSINQDNKGVIPVAILGSADFDATTVDGDTCSLGDAPVKTVGKSARSLCSIEDVSGDFSGGLEGAPDGYLDQVCKFVTIDLGADLGEVDAKVVCDDPDGIALSGHIEGTDSIRLVPPE